MAGRGERLEKTEKIRSFITCTLHQILRVIKSRSMIWAGYIARMGGMRNAHSILVGKPVGKRSHRRPRCIYGRIILEWILGKQGKKSVDWMHLAQDRYQWQAVVNTEMKHRVPQMVGNFLSS